jgi:opacity protein-like surface antigen
MRQFVVALVLLVAVVSSAAAATPRKGVARYAVQSSVPPAERWYVTHNNTYAGMTIAALARATYGFSPHVRLASFNGGRAYCLEDVVDGPPYHYVGGSTKGMSVKLAGGVLPGACPAGTGTPH